MILSADSQGFIKIERKFLIWHIDIGVFWLIQFLEIEYEQSLKYFEAQQAYYDDFDTTCNVSMVHFYDSRVYILMQI